MYEKQLCPNCEREVENNENYCEECGTQLTKQLPYDSISEGLDIEEKEKNSDIKENNLDIEDENLKLDIEDEDNDQNLEPDLNELSKEKEKEKISNVKLDDLGFDIIEILNECSELLKKKYKIYGLFGYDNAGKSAFLYSLMKQLIDGNNTVYQGYTCKDDIWNSLKENLEFAWETKKPTTTTKHKIFVYPIQNNSSENNIAFLDIGGERFARIKDWTNNLYEFFGRYLSYCSGYVIFLDLTRGINIEDPPTKIYENTLNESSEQFHSIENFLFVTSFASKIEKIIAKGNKEEEKISKLKDNDNDINEKKEDYDKKINKIKKDYSDKVREKIESIEVKAKNKKKTMKVNVPVIISLSKADLIAKYNFSIKSKEYQNLPKSISPWYLLNTLWKGRFNQIRENVPNLKVEWLSSLGIHFMKDYNEVWIPGEPLGLASIFDFIIKKPPPKWALTSNNYIKHKNFFGLNNVII